MKNKNIFSSFDKANTEKLINRRMALLTIAQAGLFSVLGARLAYLQIYKHDDYSSLSDDNRTTHRLLAPLRGNIIDISGKILATNTENYQALAVLEETGNIYDALIAFNTILPEKKINIRKILETAKKSSKFKPIKLIEDLTWEEFSKLNANAHRLQGIYPSVGYKRYYPGKEANAHLVGYVSSLSENETYNNPFSKLANAKSGKIGVEKSNNLNLRGQIGSKRLEINAFGREIRELNRVESKQGQDIQLTIDSSLQQFCYEQLDGLSGSITVTNIHTGEYLALASAPAFDPNKFYSGISHDDWNFLTSSMYKPLINKAISNHYPPGSTIKPLVALAALESGYDPNKKINCDGSYEIKDTSTEKGIKSFHCWKKKGHGLMNMKEAIQRSCDVYFYTLAREIGINKIAEVCKRFGLGEKVFNDFVEELSGTVPNKEWKKRELGYNWMIGETLVAGIGQGYFLATPAQLSLATAQLVNGGKKITPKIIYKADDSKNKSTNVKYLAKSTHLEFLKECMNVATNEQGGTSYRSRLTGKYQFAGKTGTSQVRRISETEREEGIIKNKDLEWSKRDHGIFIGYGPVSEPKFSISVLIEHGGSGSGAAAPIAKDVMNFIFNNKIDIKRIVTSDA
jgi:penicillin-binding protein 2|tara:strand:+ start:7644 stop:9524 length:1881 start_codon:yes stop_codon:yes gene_type:complete